MTTRTRGPEQTTRRTSNARPLGRAARVVSSVLKATAEQLSRVGYAALRVEDVAELSGVNKTTIYRRWPTKPDLVAAALRNAKGPVLSPETGDLRADVLKQLSDHLSFSKTRFGKGLIRFILAERGDPELTGITRALRLEQREHRVGLLSRAIERGDLPPKTDPEVVADLLFMPILTRAITFGERLPLGYIERAVDVVLKGAGARNGARAESKRAPRRALPRSR